MKFKILSLLLAVFASIGLVVSVYTEFESNLIAVISCLLYVVIPAYGAFGLWNRSPLAIGLLLVFFLSQSVRKVSPDSLLPHIAPISVSLPVSDFAQGEGYLIDFFAVFMASILGWLLLTLRKK